MMIRRTVRDVVVGLDLADVSITVVCVEKSSASNALSS